MIFRAVEDADLIRKARRGDVEAFNLLISRWEKRVFNYLLRILQNREDALDLSQDVFLKAYQNLRKLEDPGRFAAWLFRIAHNEAYSLFRKRKPEGEPECEEHSGQPVTVGGTSVFPIELSIAVSSALQRLSSDQREAPYELFSIRFAGLLFWGAAGRRSPASGSAHQKLRGLPRGVEPAAAHASGATECAG